jgi:hypothetical protein
VAKPNAALIARLEKAGFGVSLDGKNVNMNGSLASCLDIVRDFESLPFKHVANSERATEALTDTDRNKFRGGSPEKLRADLTGNLDMTPFLRAQEGLNKNGLMAKLRTKISNGAPKRKRFFSEHDGDYDLDRRFEITPFQHTHRQATQNRVVTVRVNFTISGMETSENIDRYGALCWAIADLIEKAGVQARVVLELGGAQCDTGRTQKQAIDVVLKKPGQYLAPSLLAAAMQANFFRRVGFAFVVISAEAAGLQVAENLGLPIARKDRVRFIDGELVLSPAILGGYGGYGAQIDFEELERELIKAIGPKLKAGAA